MNYLFIAIGVMLVIAAMWDALRTTVAFAGGGPITRRLASGIWSIALLIHRRKDHKGHSLLRAAGTVILLTTVFVWIAMVYFGYLLMFAAAPGAVVQSTSGAAADWAQRCYFTGYTLFTLGLGDYVPGGDGWRLLTVIATLNGLFLVTLAITYLIPVISAAANRHQLGAAVSNLGLNPQDILVRGWDGNGFTGLGDYLVQITPMIDLHAQRHLAYPVLHYFHSIERRTAAAPSLAVLHETLLILAAAVEKEARPPVLQLEPTREALKGLLNILRPEYISEHQTAPPNPNLGRLRELGIPLVSDAAFCEVVETEQRHRKLFRAYVENGGWTWGAVSGP